MAGAPSSPTVRRWELAARLRQLRLEADLTVEQVAGHLLCSPAKVSRLETAARGASPRDVRDLCVLYQVGDDERERLMSLAREAKERSWWQEYSALNVPYTTYIGLEAAASSILEFQALRVPGLLQTADYARSLILGLRPEGEVSTAVADEWVSIRLRRQAVLTAESAPEYRVVLDEAVLRRHVGSPEVMRAQALHLVRCAKMPNVALRIVPLAAGVHAGIDGGFVVLGFLEQLVSDTVYLEMHIGSVFLEREADVDQYKRMFVRMEERQALSRADSVDWLERAAGAW